MATPNKKIKVTFLWADEAALVEDFRKKSSKKMVEWANAFFGRYGFELDVVPDPATAKVADATEYCLSKTDGYEPDMISIKELHETVFREKLPTLKEWLKAYDEIAALEEQERQKRQEVIDTRTQLNNLPAGDTVGRETLRTKLDGLVEEYMQLTATLSETRAVYQNLENTLDAIDKKYKKRKEQLDFNITVRLLIAKKIIASFPFSALTGIKTKNENDKIVDANRLKIIFCRFRLSPGVLTLSRQSQPYGTTTPGISFNTYNGEFLFDGPFILINVSRYEDITIAHEIVHAAGRYHLPDQLVVRNIAQWIRTIKMNYATNKIEFESIYETVDGGYLEEPATDILNYNSKSKKPEDVTLRDDDKKRLEDANFVTKD